VGQRFQRLLANTDDRLEPGQYVNCIYEHIAGCSSKVVICCAQCGTKKVLDAAFKIGKRGKVEPAVACSGCSFFDLIELDGWGEPVW